jgi:hypothetical protein
VFERRLARHRGALASLTALSLAAGAVTVRFLPRWKPASANLADGLGGFFYGCAIGLLIVGLWARRRAPSPEGAPPA